MIAMLERELGVLLGYGFAALLAWSMPPASNAEDAHCKATS